MNKKGKDDIGGRKKARKTVRVQRAIVGLSVDDLQSRRKAGVAKPKVSDAAKKEIKDRKKAAAAANKANNPRGGASVPKLQAKHK
jgi:large subunit ribosomal protein L24e